MHKNAIGLLGIAAWLLGILFVGAGQVGAFDLPNTLQATTPVAAKAHKARKAPTQHWGLQEYFPLPTCTNGEFGLTWRVCTPRFNA